MHIVSDIAGEPYVPSVEDLCDYAHDKPDERPYETLQVCLEGLKREKLEEGQEEVAEVCEVGVEGDGLLAIAGGRLRARSGV